MAIESATQGDTSESTIAVSRVATNPPTPSTRCRPNYQQRQHHHLTKSTTLKATKESELTVPSTSSGSIMDENGCVSLASVVEAFNEPINQEQAWAVCDQACKYLLSRHESRPYQLTDLSDLKIHKDGRVMVSPGQPDSHRRKPSEKKLISSLGVTIYKALDYGYDDNDEPQLQTDLTSLIERLTSADECGRDSCDEGIERDSGEDKHSLDSSITFEKAIELCTEHMSTSDLAAADNHYRAVCRALVAEVLELSIFLAQISQSKEDGGKRCLELDTVDTALNDLHVADWARLWMQLMRELRSGVKLKKVDLDSLEAHRSLHPIEYELTPYEMLLDDIRSQRYKLNKVVIDSNDLSHRIQKDAHALILEFIRSRPPLAPVSKRKLQPAPHREKSLYEKLMISIRQKHELKPTPSHHRRSSIQLGRIKEDSHAHSDDESAGDSLEGQFNLRRCGSMPLKRAHSIRKLIKADLNLHFDSDSDSDEPPSSSSDSPLSGEDENYNSLSGSAVVAGQRGKETVSTKRNDSLTLTLKELRHIRSAITKAELDCIGMTKELRHDLELGRVCFTCLKTRFSLFTWSVTCKLCERKICEKCTKKMDIPRNMLDRFDRIPINMLIPTREPRRRTSSLTRDSIGSNNKRTGAADQQPNNKQASSSGRNRFNMIEQAFKKDRVKLCSDCQHFIVSSVNVN